MNIPGFFAETSLCRLGVQFRSAKGDVAAAATGVLPALPSDALPCHDR